MCSTDSDVITRFYQAFQRLDGEGMARCYASDVRFSDPLFGSLRGSDAADMWRMLTANAQAFSLCFEQVECDSQVGRAYWKATYRFAKSGRRVVNRVQASFVIRDGLIVEHHDHFSVWPWAAQALGLKGLLIGWTALLQRRARQQARTALQRFQLARNGAGASSVEPTRS
jgi:ketosteroid isomerase-like protein